jgi:hypothetical protein
MSLPWRVRRRGSATTSNFGQLFQGEDVRIVLVVAVIVVAEPT